MTYKINEIFTSLQGEGNNLGKKVTFIRLAGCNLSCPWCDTNHDPYTEYEIKDIIREIETSSVIITGGEPTIHNLEPLLKELKKNNIWVGIETNGINNVDKIAYYIDYIAVSPKAATEANVTTLTLADEIRVVNENLEVKDLLEFNKYKAEKFLAVLELDNKFNLEETINLLGELNERSSRKWRLNQQFHKLIGIR